MAMLRIQHARANRLCRQLDGSWQSGPAPVALRETHARKSLDATNADVAALMAFTAASLVLTARIVVRLRIALAQHSSALAEFRAEPDDPWRIKLRERTFLLYLVVALLGSTAVLIATWTSFDSRTAAITAAAVGALHVAWYPIRRSVAGRRARRRA